MDRGLELSLLSRALDHVYVLAGLQVIEPTRTCCVHHHLIELCLRVGCSKHHSLVLEIFGVVLDFLLTCTARS